MRNLLRSLVLYSLAACCAAVPANRSGAAEASGALPRDVIAAVKAASLKELTDDIVAVARRVAPGPQVEAMPFLLGAMLGDPMLQGLEAGQNIGAAMVRVEGDYQPVVFARLSEQSPYRDALRGYGMEPGDHQGWTFATVSPLEPSVLGDLRDHLVEWVQAPRVHDLELYVNGPEAARLVAENEDLLRSEIRGMGAAEYEEPIWALVQTVTGELRILASAGIGLEISGEEIVQHAHLQAQNDTALGRFLSADHAASLAPAEWFSPEAPIVYVSRMNLGALMDYFRYFQAKAEVAGGDTIRSWFEPVVDMMELFTRDTEGNNSGYVVFSDAMPSIVQISDSTADDDSLRGTLEAMLEIMSHPILAQFGEMPSTELVSGEHTVADQPVYTLTTRVGDENDVFFGEPFSSESHYVRVGDYLVVADQLDVLNTIAGAIVADEKPSPNAAELFDRDSGAASQVRIDGGLLLGYLGQMMAPGHSIEANLPPARGELQVRDNAARWRFEIPTDLIAGIYREIQAMSEQMESQFYIEEEYDFGEDHPE